MSSSGPRLQSCVSTQPLAPDSTCPHPGPASNLRERHPAALSDLLELSLRLSTASTSSPSLPLAQRSHGFSVTRNTISSTPSLLRPRNQSSDQPPEPVPAPRAQAHHPTVVAHRLLPTSVFIVRRTDFDARLILATSIPRAHKPSDSKLVFAGFPNFVLPVLSNTTQAATSHT